MRRRLAHLEADRQRRLADAETEQNLTLLVGRLDEFVERVHGGLDELDWSGTREIIRAMVRRVEIDGDHVNIVFRVPPPSTPGSDRRSDGPTPSPDGDWQDCRGRHGGLIGEDANDVGAPFDLDEAHGRTGCCFHNRLGVGHVVLLGLHIRADELRCNQPHLVAETR